VRISQRRIPLTAESEWAAALDGIPHAFAHTWESCHALWLTTAAPTYLYVWESDGGRVVCPFSERRFQGYVDVFTPYGFSGFVGVGDHFGVARSWHDFARQQGYVCAFIGMNPLLSRFDGFEPGEIYEYNDLHVLDLARSEAALFASLSKNRRRQVTACRRGSPRLFRDRTENAAFLVRHYSAFVRDRGASEVYQFSEDTLLRLLESPNSVLLGAGSHDSLEATWLSTCTSTVAEYFMTVSLPEGRHHAAALLWEGALELKRRGVRWLNLGGGVTRGDGIARFKERFGGSRLPLRALKQVFRPDLYDELCAAAGADPLDRSGFFPAYQRRPPLRSGGLHASTAGDDRPCS
jgi:hypothetical protein